MLKNRLFEGLFCGGVYRNVCYTLYPLKLHADRLQYLLVRPYPSLRITFTSPTLRIPGLLQTKFLDRVGGPQHLRDGISEAFASGTGVTAKISWLTHATGNGDRQQNGAVQGKPRWIHCTPLFGSDGKVGVWMVVLVEDEEVTGLLNRQGNKLPTQVRSGVASPIQLGAVNGERDGDNLYADYLKQDSKEGRPTTNGSAQTSSTARERREVDDQFRDF